MMIGLNKLITLFDEMINNDSLPRFIVLTGLSGSGRKTLAKHIADKLNAQLYKPKDNKVTMEYARDVIEQAYKQSNKIVYLFPDVEYFNASVANAVLKVTEEPPNNAYFIMTCLGRENIPATLRSRCTSFRIPPYSRDVLSDFATSLNVDTTSKMFLLCQTPGDIINMAHSETNYKALEDFVIKVIDNVGKVSGANVFKIDESIAFKETDTGYNLNTFWTMFCTVCLQRTKDIKNSKRNMYLSFIRATNGYREKLMLIGLNKRSLFDLWLIEIRDIYSRYN